MSTSPALTSRALALSVLEQIVAGRELDAAWSLANAHSTLDERDRSFARTLVMTTLRHFGSMEAHLATYVKKRPPLRAQLILLLGMAQMLWLDTPPHAAVDTSVTLAKTHGMTAASGMVNAVLKRIAQSRETVKKACKPEDNLPVWLRKLLVAAYGKDCVKQIAEAHLVTPPLDLYCRDADSRAHWQPLLEATLLPTGSMRRDLASNVTSLAGFAEGAWWVQDAASSLPVALFSSLRGKQALDLCAAPGGKTLQMLAAGAQVTAGDRSAQRLGRVHENLQRMQLSAHVVEADARSFAPEFTPDCILLDAPCTATGTLRRHPDVARHRTPADITELTALQIVLLEHAWSLLAAGGELVYCVCSLLPQEAEHHIARFLAQHADAQVYPIDVEKLGIPNAWITPEGGLRTLPCYWPEYGGLDGFYAICVKKISPN
ncbi:MAG: hypothetical protein K2Q12_03330 [Rickettsiales bacterium]|nr:hypothetical protein [Rickettsiales bacterium]